MNAHMHGIHVHVHGSHINHVLKEPWGSGINLIDCWAAHRKIIRLLERSNLEINRVDLYCILVWTLSYTPS